MQFQDADIDGAVRPGGALRWLAKAPSCFDMKAESAVSLFGLSNGGL